MGRISKQGDQYLRWLLVAGAMTVIRHAKRRGTTDPWLANIIADKPTKVAARWPTRTPASPGRF